MGSRKQRDGLSSEGKHKPEPLVITNSNKSLNQEEVLAMALNLKYVTLKLCLPLHCHSNSHLPSINKLNIVILIHSFILEKV